MEEYKKVIKQEDGVSSYKIKKSGHFVIESPYMACESRLSDSSINIEFGSFLTDISSYDASRTNIAQNLMMRQFYKVLSMVKDEQTLNEMKAAFGELKNMGGIANKNYNIFIGNLSMSVVSTAAMLSDAYDKMYQSEVANTKNKDKTNEQKNPSSSDQGTTTSVGDRDINNAADKMSRTVENANGVDSALANHYVMSIPANASDDMLVYMKRIFQILKHYDNNRSATFLSDAGTEIFHALEVSEKSEDLMALDDFMDDLARQGEAGRDFYIQYQSLASEYKDKFKAKDSEKEEFEKEYKRVMSEFDEFYECKVHRRFNPIDLEELIYKLPRLVYNLEDMRKSFDNSKYLEYSENIGNALGFLKRVKEQVLEYDTKYKRVMDEYDYVRYNNKNMRLDDVETIITQLTNLEYETEEIKGALSRSQYNRNIEDIEDKIREMRKVQSLLEETGSWAPRRF